MLDSVGLVEVGGSGVLECKRWVDHSGVKPYYCTPPLPPKPSLTYLNAMNSFLASIFAMISSGMRLRARSWTFASVTSGSGDARQLAWPALKSSSTSAQWFLFGVKYSVWRGGAVAGGGWRVVGGGGWRAVGGGRWVLQSGTYRAVTGPSRTANSPRSCSRSATGWAPRSRGIARQVRPGRWPRTVGCWST